MARLADQGESGSGETGRDVRLWLIVGVFLAAMLGIWFLLPLGDWLQRLEASVRALGALGYLLFGVIYIVATVLLAPGSLFTLAAGLAFGLWAIPLVVVAATIGAALSFLVGRYFARRRVMRLVESRPALRAADAAIADDGWKIVLLMRLSPVVPFNLQNYFFGVTDVGFWPYVAATLVGIIPGTALYVGLGAAGQAASSGALGPAQWALLSVGLLATVLVTILVARKARARLKTAGVREKAQVSREAS